MAGGALRVGSIGFADGVIDQLVELDDGSGLVESEVALLEGILRIGFSARDQVRALAALTATTPGDEEYAVARVAQWFREGTIGIMNVATSAMSFRLEKSSSGALADIIAVEVLDDTRSFSHEICVPMTREAKLAYRELLGTQAGEVVTILIGCIEMACVGLAYPEPDGPASMVAIVADKIDRALQLPDPTAMPISLQTLGVEITFVLDLVSGSDPFRITSVSLATH